MDNPATRSAGPGRVGFALRIPPRMHQRLKALARRDKRSMQWEAEQAIGDWIERRAAEHREAAS